MDDGHVDLSLSETTLFPVEHHGILLLDLNILEPGDHTDHRYTGQLVQQLASLVEQGGISPELVNDNSFHERFFLRTQQGDRAIDRSKHTASVNVCHQVGSGSRTEGHTHVGDVAIPQVQLRDAASSLQHDRVVASSQSLESGCRGVEESFFLLVPTEVILGGKVADRFATEHHLRGLVASRFQQYGVHVGMRSDAARFGLHHLCPSHLAPLRCRVGVKRHVLCLERSGLITILLEDTAEGSVDHALASVGTGADKHNGTKLLFHSYTLYYYRNRTQKYVFIA